MCKYLCACVCVCVWTAISWANKQRFAIFHFKLCGKGVNRKVKAVKTNEIKYCISVCGCVYGCVCVCAGVCSCVCVYWVGTPGWVHVWQLQLGLLHLLQSLPQSKVKRLLQPSLPLLCPLYLPLSLSLALFASLCAASKWINKLKA